MKKIINLILTASLLSGVTGLSVASPTSYGFAFAHQDVTVRDLAPNYTAALNSAAADYITAGNFTFTAGPTNLNPPFSGHVAFEEVSIGSVTWRSIATAYNAADEPCTFFGNPGGATGNCINYIPADYGHIRFNTFQISSPSDLQKNNLVRHEFGHILGRNHDTLCWNNTATSVMESFLECTPLFEELTPADVTYIGIRYN